VQFKHVFICIVWGLGPWASLIIYATDKFPTEFRQTAAGEDYRCS